MTTRNVNGSCDVLWISRQQVEQVAQFFDTVQTITAVPDVASSINDLVGVGARWLAAGSTERDRIDADYLYPRGAAYSDVVACSWHKDTSTPAGVFGVTLKPRVPYAEIIKPGDVFILFMDDDHEYGADRRSRGVLVTIGIVDRVVDATAATSDGATVETVSVNGRDLGAIFQETETVFDNAFAVVDQTLFTAKYLKRFSDDHVNAMSPAESTFFILDLIYNQNATGSRLVGAQWSFRDPQDQDGTGRPISLLRVLDATSFVQVPMYGYSYPNPLAASQAGNVWTLLDSFANRVVNEFFVDVRDAGPQEANFLSVTSAAAANHVEDSGDRQRQFDAAAALRDTGVFSSSGFAKASPGGPDQPEIDFDEPEEFQGAPEITFDDPEEIVASAPASADSTTPVMAVVHRQLPYDRDAFMALPYNDLHHDETFDTNFGYSSHDAVNFFRMSFPEIPNILQEKILGVAINADSVVKYGLRRMEGESRFSFPNAKAGRDYRGGASAVLLDSYKFYVGLLTTWYAANDKLLAGEISCRFNPKIRVGTRLRFTAITGRVFHFYVQAVNHNFSVQPGGSRSHLTVIRGIDEADDGIANHLIWNASGNAIPDNLVNFIFVKPIAKGST